MMSCTECNNNGYCIFWKAEKIYAQIGIDKVKHIGYIIAGVWLTIYRIEDWK